MATSTKSSGTLNSSGSGAGTGKIATLPGGFRASEVQARERIDLINDIDRRLAQLTALLQSIYGGGFESFNGMNERLQDNILWLASDLAEEIKNDFGAITSHVSGESSNG